MQKLTSLWYNLPIRYKGLGVILIPAVCLAVLLVTVLAIQAEEQDAQRWVAHSEQVRAEARHLLAVVADAQGDVRGFDLTRDPRFLEGHQRNLDEAKKSLDRLRAAVGDNQHQLGQVDEIASLTKARLDHFQVNLAVARRPDSPVRQAALARSLIEGLRLMSSLEAAVGRFDTEEERLLLARRARLAAQQERSSVLFWVAALFGIAGGLVVTQLFSRGITERVGQLANNAERVAQGQPFCAHPLGTDEIGRLDQVFRDMVGRLKEREERLREGRNALREITTLQRAILDSATYTIISVDPQGIIRTFNPTAERLLGYSAAELVGKATPEVFHDAEEVTAYAAQLSIELETEVEPGFEAFVARARRGMPDEREWSYIRKDGTRFPVLLTVSALCSAEGEEITGFVGVGQDITERKEYERKLVEAREAALAASRAKSEFLATVSHEIRTPLNAILGMADLLSETELTNEQRQWVNVFRRSGGTLLELINDLLDLSRVEARQLELETAPLQVRPLVEEAVEVFHARAAEKGLRLGCEVASEVPTRVMGDSHRLRQILMNLLGNAVKFTEVGEVRLRVECAGDGRLAFTVTDTGSGIPEEKLGAIFEAFTQVDSSTTRRYGGSGLGLAISSRLAQLMGGAITVKSTLGAGSSFRCEVPLPPAAAPATAPPPGPRALAPAVPNGHHKILLADDSPDNRLLIQAFLKRTPYELVTAENGVDAVARFTAERFDLVLMDVQMPEMDGYAATRAIREWESAHGRTGCPILALTANALAEDEERSREAGCSGHLTKPIRKALLIETLDRHLSPESSDA